MASLSEDRGPADGARLGLIVVTPPPRANPLPRDPARGRLGDLARPPRRGLSNPGSTAMRRLAAALLLVALALPANGQTPAEMARTAALIESWQNPDGGFGASKGGKSSLGITSSAI